MARNLRQETRKTAEEEIMTPEMRKRLERFLFGLRPKEEEFKYPWEETPQRPYGPFMDEAWKHFNYRPEYYRKPTRRKTSRDAEQQMNMRNWRLIHSGKYRPSLLV